MKRFLLTAILLFPWPANVQAAPPPPDKPFAAAADVSALLARAKAENKPGDLSTSKLVVSADGLPLMLEYRLGDRQAEPAIHPTMAELIQVVEGSCTFVLGGEVIGATPAKPAGTKTEGGVAFKLKPGDYVFVPANLPHWFTDVRQLAVVTLHIPVAPR